MQDKFNILVIDDDPYVIDAFELILEDMDNCNLFSFVSFSQAKELVNKEKINLALIDIVLPEIDGYEVCRILKQHQNANKAYFILMSADKHQLLDRIKAYKVGAQEFLSKPFDLKEVELIILSKIEFQQQTKDKTFEETENFISVGKFLLDEKKRVATLGNTPLDLTKMEYDLLKFLISNPEKNLDIDDIIAGVWRDLKHATSDNARSLVHRFRTKIESDPKKPYYLINSKTSGYIFYPSGSPF